MEQQGLPVDRGWAWMVMVGNFTNVFVTISFIRSLAILLPVFLEKYKQPAAVTTLAFGMMEIMESTANILIPFALLPRFSVRAIALCGAVVHSTAIMALAFTSNIVLLNVFFGCIGFSRGLLTNPPTFILGFYFNKRLSFANAFAAMGLSAATLIAPLATRFLLDTYDLQWTFLIFSACSLHCVVASLLLRPTSFYQNGKTNTDNANEEFGDCGRDCSHTVLMNEAANCRDNLQTQQDPPLCDLAKWTPRDNRESEATALVTGSENRRLDLGEREPTTQSSFSGESDIVTNTREVQFLNNRRDEAFAASCSASSCSCKRSRSKVILSAKFEVFRRWFHHKLSTSLLTNSVALLLLLAAGLGSHTQAGNVYLPVLGLENGLKDHQLPWLLTITGSCDIAAKLVIGYLTDRHFLHPLYTACVTQIIPGIAFQLVPLFQGMGAMATLCVLYGSTSGVLRVLYVTLVVRMVGLSSLPRALSAYFLLNCLVTFIMHVVVGSTKDATNSFVGGFRFVGGLLLTSAVLLILVRPVSKGSFKSGREATKEGEADRSKITNVDTST